MHRQAHCESPCTWRLWVGKCHFPWWCAQPPDAVLGFYWWKLDREDWGKILGIKSRIAVHCQFHQPIFFRSMPPHASISHWILFENTENSWLLFQKIGGRCHTDLLIGSKFCSQEYGTPGASGCDPDSEPNWSQTFSSLCQTDGSYTGCSWCLWTIEFVAEGCKLAKQLSLAEHLMSLNFSPLTADHLLCVLSQQIWWRWFSWLASMFPKAHQLFVPSAMMTLCLLEFLVSLRVCPDGDVWHNVWTAEHVQSSRFTSDKFRLVCICYALEGIVNMCQGGLRRNRSETDLVWCHSISTEAVSFQNFAFRWGKDANLQNNYP